ncbi:sugar phosphate nucleotidyltransferase [Halobacillus sp. BAB-2008]|uniref:sugar phosphate nucleotidyltransferase n=1 Tax=Halobacillus sp. BAB-2008 TaxID=1246484 RepID=UPI0002A5099E|nr:sugar phosphate nucleotidyltransferase [Halobacillus sp. BAB-2008]ELK48569.1 mannose-1-phosphate guanylyltransferase [Halobacillus sp. BAB-2008]
MKLVLLSGGAGKRLWPLSNGARSKQFLRVLKNEAGELESMVQRVWRQIKQVQLDRDTLIATGRHQVENLEHQLDRQATLILEPERRDTFAAIALSASYLYSIEGESLQSVIGVLPVDPYVEDHFFTKVAELEQALEVSGADIGLIGVTPTYPSSKYGYIIPSPSGYSDLLRVRQFKEKPTEEAAEGLIDQGGLWNSGVFAFKLEYIIALLMDMGLPVHYEELVKQYFRLPKNSFDYEVVEQADNVVALPYEGFWKDLGTWNTLTEEMGTAATGNGRLCSGSENTHVINELDIPIKVIGVQNAIVAASPDGILVADKQQSPRIKEFLGEAEERIRFVEESWGTARTLEALVDGKDEYVTTRVSIHKGHAFESTLLADENEVWTVVKGEGLSIGKDQESCVHAGDVIHLLPETGHVMKAKENLEIIVVRKARCHQEEAPVETISN